MNKAVPVTLLAGALLALAGCGERSARKPKLAEIDRVPRLETLAPKFRETFPVARDYTATAVTANGRIKAAPARIDRIEVGGITVYDVPAMVLPDEVLSKNLLGVSFLSRLRRYEYANGRLLLEQ